MERLSTIKVQLELELCKVQPKLSIVTDIPLTERQKLTNDDATGDRTTILRGHLRHYVGTIFLVFGRYFICQLRCFSLIFIMYIYLHQKALLCKVKVYR